MANPALAKTADTDLASTLAVGGGVRAFADGGEPDIPEDDAEKPNLPMDLEEGDVPAQVQTPPSSPPVPEPAPDQEPDDSGYKRVKITRAEAIKQGLIEDEEAVKDYKRVKITRDEAMKRGIIPSDAESSGPGAFARRIRGEALPFAGGLAAGALGAAAGTAAFPGVGTLAGFLIGLAGAGIGGAAGGYATKEAQDKLVDALGWRDEKQEQADVQQHENWQKAADLAMVPAAFAGGPAKIAQRIMSGVGMGAITAGTDAARGEFNPGEAALAVAEGGLFPNPRKLTQKLMGPAAELGTKLGQKVGGIPGMPGQPLPPERGLPKPSDFTVPPEGPPEPTQPGGPGSVFGQTEGVQGGTKAENERPIYERRGNPAGNPSVDASYPEMPASGGPPAVAANDNAGGLQSQPGRPDLTPDPYSGYGIQGANDNQRRLVSPKTPETIVQDKTEAATSEPLKVGTLGTSVEQAPPPKDVTTTGNPQSRPTRDRDTPGNEDGRGYAKGKDVTEGEPPAITHDDGSGFTPDVTAAVSSRLRGNNANDNAKAKPSKGMNNIAREENAPRVNTFDRAGDVTADNTNYKNQGQAAADAYAAHDVATLPRGEVAEPEPVAKEHPAIAERSAVHDQAVRELEKRGLNQVAEALRGKGDKEANQVLDALKEADAIRTRTEKRPVNEETGAKEKDKLTAALRAKQVADQNRIFEAHGGFEGHLPNTIEERTAAQQKLREHVEAWKKSLDPDEVRKMIAHARPGYSPDELAAAVQQALKPYKARETTAAQAWLRDAEKLANLKRPPTSKALAEFVANDKLRRSGKEGVDMARQTNRIGADIAMSRRGGEKAVESREAELARLAKDTEARPGEEVENEPQHLVDEIHPEEAKSLHEDAQLAENLNKVEHDAVMEEAKQEPLRGIDNGPSKKVRGNETPLHEQFASIDKDKMARLAALRKAKDPSQKPADKDIKGGFWDDERGSLDIDKIAKTFVNMKKSLGKWLDDMIGVHIVPARRGLMGSTARGNAQVTEAVMAKFMSTMSQGKSYMQHLTDAHYASMLQPDKDWDPKTMSKREYVEARNWNFINNWEHGTPQKNKFLQDTQDFLQQQLDLAYNMEKFAGSKAEYRQNYLSHLFEDPADAAKFDAYMQNKHGPTWFQKERAFNTYWEAHQAGFKMKFTNPVEIVSHRLAASVSMTAKMEMINELNKFGLAYPVVDAPKEIKGRNSPWQIENMPDQRQWLVSPDAMPIWKNAMERDALWQDKNLMGSSFRTWMAAKATWVPVKLMLSGFHYIHEMGIHINAGMMDGWNLTGKKDSLWGFPTNSVEAGKAFKGAVKGTVQAAREVGTYSYGAAVRSLEPVFPRAAAFASKWDGFAAMDKFNRSNYFDQANTPETTRVLKMMGLTPQSNEDFKIRGTQNFKKAMHEEDMWGMTKGAIPEAMKRFPLTTFLFDHFIPGLKTVQALRSHSLLMEQHPEYLDPANEGAYRAAARKLGKNVDERYGEANYSTMFWNKTLKNVGVGSFLSLSWNVGFANTVSGAITDNVRSAGIMLNRMNPKLGYPERNATEQAIHDASNKMSYVAGYTGTAMLLTGVMSYALSGEAPSVLDMVYPRAGGINPDGSPRRLTTMMFTREPVMLEKHAEASGGYLSGLGHMIWNKMVLAPIVSQATNRDFFNRELSDPDASFFTRMGQRALSGAHDMLTPISFESRKTAQRTGGGTRDEILSWLGFGPAAAYLNKTPMQNRIAHEYYEGPGAAVKPYVNKERDQKRIDLFADRARAQQAGDKAAEKKAVEGLIATGMPKKTAEKATYGKQDILQFSRLDAAKKVSLVKEMKPEEFKRYVLDPMPRAELGRIKNNMQPHTRVHADMVTKWKELGNKIPF